MDTNACCQICVKEFFKVSNLRRHIRQFHPEVFKELPKKTFAFTCTICFKNFSYLKNYRSHLKTHDPNPLPSTRIKKCSLCAFNSDKIELYKHFETDHGIKLTIEKLTFESSECFMRWKVALEDKTKNIFVRNYTQQTKYYDEVVLYICSRSQNSLQKVKKRSQTNSVLSKKIAGFCPASIKMMKKGDGSVSVSFVETHVGHTNDEKITRRDTAKKLKSIKIRHKTSSTLGSDALVENEGTWQYHSPNREEMFTIAMSDDHCGYDCPFTCSDCKTCIHKYSCSCKDWTIKWNMCIHIHLLCRVLNEREAQQLQIVTQPSNSSVDGDLIVYDAGTEEVDNDLKSPIMVQEFPQRITMETKNIILQEFSDILLKCNSSSLFQEIVIIVGDLKTRIESEDISSAAHTS